MGTPQYRFPDVGPHVGHSLFVAILSDLDQTNLYDAVNFNKNIYTYANHTVQAHGLASLWCPSDPGVSGNAVYDKPYQDIPAGRFVIAYSSYAGCAGTWYHLTDDLNLTARLARQDNGIAYVDSAVRISDAIDGASQTLLLGERAHGRLAPDVRLIHHWWFDGYQSDTLFWTLYPINPNSALAVGDPQLSPFFAAAGSFHAGGATFAFLDGSVKFLKDSIESWPIDPTTAMPLGVAGSPSTPYTMAAGTRLGIYQSLSTSAGGEVISPYAGD